MENATLRTNIMFQSTRPRGARRWAVALVFTWLIVSIHAPARGATPLGLRSLPSALRFNPRAREGRDAIH